MFIFLAPTHDSWMLFEYIVSLEGRIYKGVFVIVNGHRMISSDLGNSRNYIATSLHFLKTKMDNVFLNH